MITPDALESFLSKWNRQIESALEVISSSVRSAGYEVSQFELQPGFLDEELPVLKWFMYVSAPNRPEEETDRDVMISFDVIANEPENNFLTAVLEAETADGMIDDMKISTPLLIGDPSWLAVWENLKAASENTVGLLNSWLPLPSKRVWRVGGLRPGSQRLHPSIHTNDEIAKGDISAILEAVLERATALLFKLDAEGRRQGWDASTSTALMNARLTLHNGKPLRALRMYHRLLEDLNPAMLQLMNDYAGTVDVDIQGTLIEEFAD